ncbi:MULTISPECIES: hypothetical protein [Alteromonas]|uniref:Phytase-like domain-containing protein n=1 Tax=Alteromonas stellipolaris TaxID=233316 RepID=A0AAW7Z1S5_9ALTE|nr:MULTISPECIES: hypothetical protein [Alteromonas]AMJ92798.1 hypothetical protein AV940_16715 [Alteromonas sp. Mac2]AMJ76520.1 hypothetical protein AVL57_18025 [Alteromonas stellipolaris]AMJ88948.1 hypothetical protein AV939_16965 [Alteromonas sp. Mac1]ANB23524.1 hypothetical protein A6K25_07710 [Alteromonas stellipolaris]MDO6578695.1 hypothetical protein [Alteromonas stellipolaris]
MLKNWPVAACVVVALSSVMAGCSESKDAAFSEDAPSATTSSVLTSVGRWISTDTSDVMQDPQTSGLIEINGQLVTIADGSAAFEQQRKLHFLDKDTATLTASSNAFKLATRVRRSCFSDYLTNAPDLEALASDPSNSNVIYTVTEDATRTGTLSTRCEKKYQNTGSTDYPTLLVRLERDENDSVTMTHVRPLQFPTEFEVGNFPNDGIEGMAMSKDGTLYLGLEKDKAGQPRIFSLNITDDFWQSADFAVVDEPDLSVPIFDAGSHPINGLALYSAEGGNNFLLAAARNDNEVWVIDVAGKVETKRISMQFNVSADNECGEYVMDNASIEGLAVVEDTLWLINDPWKVNYLKNIKCEAETPRYEAMAPLLFSVPLNDAWFQ